MWQGAWGADMDTEHMDKLPGSIGPCEIFLSTTLSEAARIGTPSFAMWRAARDAAVWETNQLCHCLAPHHTASDLI